MKCGSKLVRGFLERHWFQNFNILVSFCVENQVGKDQLWTICIWISFTMWPHVFLFSGCRTGSEILWFAFLFSYTGLPSVSARPLELKRTDWESRSGFPYRASGKGGHVKRKGSQISRLHIYVQAQRQSWTNWIVYQRLDSEKGKDIRERRTKCWAVVIDSTGSTKQKNKRHKNRK